MCFGVVHYLLSHTDNNGQGRTKLMRHIDEEPGFQGVQFPDPVGLLLLKGQLLLQLCPVDRKTKGR